MARTSRSDEVSGIIGGSDEEKEKTLKALIEEVRETLERESPETFPGWTKKQFRTAIRSQLEEMLQNARSRV